MFVLSAGFLHQAYICVDFFVNQDEIAEEHCENKDKPILKCNGKCHLAKMLKESEPVEDDAENEKTSLKLKVPDLFVCSKDISAEIIHYSELNSRVLFSSNSLFDEVPHGPPKVA